jgi:hypothetical protein
MLIISKIDVSGASLIKRQAANSQISTSTGLCIEQMFEKLAYRIISGAEFWVLRNQHGCKFPHGKSDVCLKHQNFLYEPQLKQMTL